MMQANRPRWFLACLLAVWIAAVGTARAADPPASPPAPPTRSAESNKDESPPARVENPPAAPAKSSVKPSGREKKAPPVRKPFRPSEEIHVDKAVDFPADI
jgi:hypothetical protein